QDVAVHVAPRSDRGEARFADRAHRVLDVALRHVVQLNGLARRQTHAAARVTLRDPVDREPLRRRQDTARQADADHEDVVGLELLLRALVADIAVVLLVYPVKLQELPIFLGDRAGHGIGERALDGAAQETARALDVLDRGQWL